MPPSSTPRRAGRRPGGSSTREAIAATAREQFAELGYARTTMRGVASAAGVDPALVIHFYGSKEALFRSVMELPADAAERLGALAEGERETIGERLATVFATLLETPATRAVLMGRLRAAAAEPEAASLVHELVSRDLGRLAEAISDDRPETRAALAGSQLVGIGFVREIVGVEPLPSLSRAELAALLGPTLQHYLTGQLD
jgi:AcrR family transcriptional regulator